MRPTGYVCGHEGCPSDRDPEKSGTDPEGRPPLGPRDKITVEWFDRHAHIWMDFCSWTCLDAWRATQTAHAPPP